MRVWFDTEFVEDGKTIELLSIGLVREDGHYYYAEVAETDRSRANPWVQVNVLPHLGKQETTKRADIAADLIKFAGEKPEFWAYYASYDWVVLCQLYGRMIDLPHGWPMWCRDFKQVLGEYYTLGKSPDAHHALADAQHLREAHLQWEKLHR